MANNKDRRSQEKVLSSRTKQHLSDLMAQKNVLSDETYQYIQGYLIYLRKSRQDDPNETVEEVLAKHERQLQELAMRELGGYIPEENIYREIVSGGESIDERIEIKRVLSRLEDDGVRGVLVIDPQRLSRGSLTDCDKLITSFQFTDTLVVTPMMTYDMKKKMERRFFQDELMRGRDYLDYVKETLWRGRTAAAKRGCFASSIPPYGFSRIKVGKDWTLEPNEDADTVRMIFDWYVRDGLSLGEIARRLNELGIPTANNKTWHRNLIGYMIRNPHYAGRVRFNHRKKTPMIENGTRVVRNLIQPDDVVMVTEGKHTGIVDIDIFEAAQKRVKQNPSAKKDFDLQNVLAGLLRCEKCGKTVTRVSKGGRERFQCRTAGCCKSASYDTVVEGVLTTLERVELPELQVRLANGDGSAVAIQKRRIDKLVKQLAEYRDQEDKQYELLETGKYTQDVFDRRNHALREKMMACEREIHTARQSMPTNINYAERIVALQDAINALKDSDVSIEQKNRVLRAIIDHIEYSSTDRGFGETDIRLKVHLRL